MNLSRKLAVIAAVLIVSPAFVPAVLAANGDVPIYQPTTISQPGHYVVTRDISAQGDVLTVTTDGVTVDLNGHVLKSVTGSGVVLNLGSIVAPCDIVFLDGRIEGGAYGINGAVVPEDLPLVVDSVGLIGPMFDCIHLPNAPILRLRNSTLRGCGGSGVLATGNATGLVDVRDTVISDVQGDGILMSSVEGATIRDTVIRRYGLAGNEAGGVHAIAPGKGGLSVLDTSLFDAGALAIGILVDNAGALPAVQLAGNRISGAGASGIDLRSSVATISGSTITKNGGDGIRLDDVSIVGPAMITGNSIMANALNGVDLRSGSVDLTHNTIGANGQNGVRVDGVRALIDGNNLEGNTGLGLILLNGTGHAYRGNFLRGNTGGSLQDQFNNTDAGGNIY